MIALSLFNPTAKDFFSNDHVFLKNNLKLFYHKIIDPIQTHQITAQMSSKNKITMIIILYSGSKTDYATSFREIRARNTHPTVLIE